MSLRFTSIQAPNADATCASVTAYIGARLGIGTEFVIDLPWQERGRRLLAGEIHIGWVCGLPYVRAVAEAPDVWRPLVAPVMAASRYAGLPVYFSDITARAGSPIGCFADLRGRRWAYNEPASHSGYGIVRAHLATLGEKSDFFGEVIEAGSHQAALEMILDGHVDAAAIDSTVLETELRARPELVARLQVVETLGPSPAPLWVAHRAVPAEVCAIVRSAFLSMANELGGQDVLTAGTMSRFAPVEDADYDPIRQMARQADSIVWRE